jgi:AcrR family transcriptional regulator
MQQQPLAYFMSTLSFTLDSTAECAIEYEQVHIIEGLPMRVTAETKSATRKRIIHAARRLFAANGFDATTTRDIAIAAEIATGTLFNYFPTKEAILAYLAADAAAAAQLEFEETTGQAVSFEEDLFAFVAAGLRKLKPLRRHLTVLLETALCPLAAAADGKAQSLRLAHLETIARLATKHHLGELPSMALQLYWTLYTGVLMFWAADDSPKQEDTLALLDHSVAMFVGWLRREGDSGTKAEGET